MLGTVGNEIGNVHFIGDVMKKFLVAGAALAVLIGTPALAADMPVKAPAPAPVPFSWTGFYIGANAGGVWGRTDPSFLDNDGCGIPGLCNYFTFGAGQGANMIAVNNASQKFNNNGFTGGLQAGYNWQTGIFVLGGEADFEYFKPKGSATYPGVLPPGGLPGEGGSAFVENYSASANWLATFRARVGMTTGHWLFFGTVGPAVAQLNFNASYADTTTSPPLTSGTLVSATSSSAIKAGVAGGGGVEYAIDNHWLVRAEYLFVQVNEGYQVTQATVRTGVPTGAGGGGFGSQFTYAPMFRENIVRAALSYKF
jgi:outer membrane immunogenic protein